MRRDGEVRAKSLKVQHNGVCLALKCVTNGQLLRRLHFLYLFLLLIPLSSFALLPQSLPQNTHKNAHIRILPIMRLSFYIHYMHDSGAKGFQASRSRVSAFPERRDSL